MSSFPPLSSPDPLVSGAAASGIFRRPRRARRSVACPHCGEMPSKPQAAPGRDHRRGLPSLDVAHGEQLRQSDRGCRRHCPGRRRGRHARPSIQSSTPASKRAARQRWPASWPEVAAATGLSRSAAAERWAQFDSAPKAHGQPATLR